MKDLLYLFWTFFKIGSCTFGGGYAMLPIIQRELVEKKSWVTNEEITDYYAMGQMTPGVIAVNVSTFVGMKRKGVIGAIFTTLGMITPSIIIILLIATVLENFWHLEFVTHAFAGIRVAVLGMMVKTIVTLYKNGIKDIFTFILFLLTLSTIFVDITPTVVVILSALAGIFYKRVVAKK